MATLRWKVRTMQALKTRAVANFSKINDIAGLKKAAIISTRMTIPEIRVNKMVTPGLANHQALKSRVVKTANPAAPTPTVVINEGDGGFFVTSK